MARSSVDPEDNKSVEDQVKELSAKLDKVNEYLAKQMENFIDTEKDIKDKLKVNVFLIPEGTWFGKKFK